MLQCTWQIIKADIGFMHSFFVVLYFGFFGKISLRLLPHTDKTICAIPNLATSDILRCYYSTIHGDAKTQIIYDTPPNVIWCVVVAVTTGLLLYHWNGNKSTDVLRLQLAILYGHCYDLITILTHRVMRMVWFQVSYYGSEGFLHDSFKVERKFVGFVGFIVHDVQQCRLP